MLWVLLGCSAGPDARDWLDPIVAAAGARLTWVSCGRAERSPPSWGCVYQGGPDEVAKLVAHTRAEPSPPRTNVSLSPCVRNNRVIGRQLPGSDDWYPKEGVVTWRPAATLGDLYVLGDQVCIEVQ